MGSAASCPAGPRNTRKQGCLISTAQSALWEALSGAQSTKQSICPTSGEPTTEVVESGKGWIEMLSELQVGESGCSFHCSLGSYASVYLLFCCSFFVLISVLACFSHTCTCHL